MPLRLTTPGILIAALIALAIGGGAAWKMAAPEAPQVLPIVQAPKATSAHALGNFNPALIYEQRASGVVTLDALFGSQSVGGTGFLVDNDGHILTSSHVIVDYANGGNEADAVWIDFKAGDRVEAKIVGVDRFSDIAVLKVDADKVDDLKPVPLGDSDKVIVGEPVAAIGSPFGNKGSLSTGIVSAAHRSIDAVISKYQIADAIQTDAAINHGNSGGPLFNGRGQVIGINQQIRATGGQSAGVGFAIPINTAKRSLAQILDTGTVKYAYLGVKTTTITPQIAEAFKLPHPTGVLIDTLTPNSPATKAGMREGTGSKIIAGKVVRDGDQVVSIAGMSIRSTEDVNRAVARLDVGSTVKVEYYRDGKLASVDVLLAERPLAS